MGGEHGVKNALLVLMVLAEGGNVAEDMIKAEGNIWGKLAKLSSLFDEIMALTGLDGAALMKELGELDAEDLGKLQTEFKVKFDLEDDKVEAIIENGLGLAQKGYDFVAEVIAFVQSISAAKKVA